MNKSTPKTIFSGVKPSGDLHLGNYAGAVSLWVELQKAYRCIFCVVDYHAITVKQEPEQLRRWSIEIVKHYIAAGIDPKQSIIFQQSDVSAHTELAWILNTQSRMSDLLRMTQFKDKTGLQFDLEAGKLDIPRDVFNMINKAGVGLFDYPALMAADILLYDTDLVPVGEDQVQHVELTRTLAKRFNSHYGETFKVPAAQVRGEGARIMSLDNPLRKMGKSESSSGSIILTESPKAAAKKIMRAVTDSESEVRYDKRNKPAISNLLTIYQILSKRTIKQLEEDYAGKGYGDFKKGLAAAVEAFLDDYQQKFNRYSDDEIRDILRAGAAAARELAEPTLARTKQRLGIGLN